MWTVVGHTRAVSLFRSSLREGRLSHAYLLTGPAHVGKMALAVNVAQALNCTGEEPPCGQCSACRRMLAERYSDVQVIDLKDRTAKDGKPRKEISIDDVRALQRSAALPPFEGKWKVFIIDGAEYFSQEAANCLLKVLEEPPPQVVFFLLSASESALLPTITSRCVKVELSPLSAPAIEAHLIERGIEAGKARLLSRVSQGRLGWAVRASADEKFWQERTERIAALSGVSGAGLEERFAFAASQAEQFEKDRAAVEETLGLWVTWWRDLLLAKEGLLTAITNVDQEETLKQEAERYSLAEIDGFLQCLRAAREQLQQNANRRLALEVLVLNLPKERPREGRRVTSSPSPV